MHLGSVNWAANWKNFPVDIEEKLVTNNFSSERYKLSSAKHRTASDAFADNIKNGKVFNSLLLMYSMVLLVAKLHDIFLILLHWNRSRCSWFKITSAVSILPIPVPRSRLILIPYAAPDWMWDVTLLTPWRSWGRGQPWGSLLPWLAWVAAYPCRNDCFCFNNKLKASRFSTVFDSHRGYHFLVWCPLLADTLVHLAPKGSPKSSLLVFPAWQHHCMPGRV